MPFKSIHQDIRSIIGDDFFKQLESALKDKDVVLELAENHIPKTRFDEINTQVKDHKAKADKYEKDLAEALKGAKSAEELQKTIKDLNDARTKDKADYDAQIVAKERDHAITDAARTAGVKNVKAFMPFLDLTKVALKEGKLDGFDAQVEALRKAQDTSFLFNAPAQPGKIGSDLGGGTGQPANPAAETAAKALASQYLGHEVK